MKFDDFDKQMRVYENAIDQTIIPNMYVVARLDGHAFTKLTKNQGFKKPFDVKFRNMMIEVVKALMDEYNVVYGYTESDEISLLFKFDDTTFNRKVRKLNSLLPSLAGAVFSRELGDIGVFDCRIIPLPSKETVTDYFLWRQEDSNRNALNGYCYWTLRQKDNVSKRKATSILSGKGTSFKNELLFEHGINYNDVEDWHKRGVGVYFKEYEKKGFNPKENKTVVVKRRSLFVDEHLPIKEEYREFISSFLDFREPYRLASMREKV